MVPLPGAADAVCQHSGLWNQPEYVCTRTSAAVFSVGTHLGQSHAGIAVVSRFDETRVCVALCCTVVCV